MECPLCFSPGRLFHSQPGREYLECRNCKGIFVPKMYFLDPVSEKERYLTHNNDVDDPRYQSFVSPIVEWVIINFNPRDHVGLDFGAGTGPVITKLLSDLQYEIFAYDPFFLPFPELLHRSYDFIACCEVIEHFQNPAREFELLKSMLLPGGQLICMTHTFHSHSNFKSWYYKDDPTHVFISREETFEFIREKYQFRELKIKDRLIVLSL